MIREIASFAACVALLGLVVMVGWNEPIRYRFLTKAELAELEHPPDPAPAALPVHDGAWMRDPNYRTALEKNTILGRPEASTNRERPARVAPTDTSLAR